MGEQSEAPSRQKRPLVSVERQTEHDLFTGEQVERRFVKMYFEARESGLLADIPDELWKTLCALATYIDDKGECFPSQETLARDLGIGRQAVNTRVKRLREYRFQGQAVLGVSRNRTRTKKGQTRWGSNVYQLLPVTGFTFGRKGRGVTTPESSVSRSDDIEDDSVSMSPGHDIEPNHSQGQESPKSELSMSPSVSPQTRHKQERTRIQIHTPPPDDPERSSLHESPEVCVGLDLENSGGQKTEVEDLVQRFHGGVGSATNRRASKRELEQAVGLLERLGQPRAEALVDYALGAAKETNFKMRHFGAVLGYEAEAEEALRRNEQRRLRAQREERERFEKDLERRYYDWRRQIVGEAIDAMDPDELETKRSLVARKLEADGCNTRFGFDGLVRSYLEERVAAERGIPPFPEWRSREYPQLKRAGVA